MPEQTSPSEEERRSTSPRRKRRPPKDIRLKPLDVPAGTAPVYRPCRNPDCYDVEGRNPESPSVRLEPNAVDDGRTYFGKCELCGAVHVADRLWRKKEG